MAEQKENTEKSETVMGRTTGNGSGLATAEESPISAMERSGPGGKRGSAATGPRTEQGKQNASRNATTHGVLSKIIVLKGESRADYEGLLAGLREDRQPEGALEELLVEKLAITTWRQRRLLLAEGAEIRKGTEFFRLEGVKRQVEEKAMVVNFGGVGSGGLMLKISDPSILQKSLSLLQTLEFTIEMNGFYPSGDMKILLTVFGQSGSSQQNNHIMPYYYQCAKDANLSEDEREKQGRPSATECKANFLQELKRKIELLEQYGESIPEFEAPKKELDALSRNVPETPQLVRLLRYEASLERAFDRALSQLERLQRMRMGQYVPPPAKVDVGC